MSAAVQSQPAVSAAVPSPTQPDTTSTYLYSNTAEQQHQHTDQPVQQILKRPNSSHQQQYQQYQQQPQITQQQENLIAGNPMVHRDVAALAPQPDYTGASNSASTISSSASPVPPESYGGEGGQDETSTIDAFLVATARNPKDRLFLLKCDQDIGNLLASNSPSRLEYVDMNSYQRLIIHRIAQHYKMGHYVDKMRRAVIVHRTPESEFPKERLQDIPLLDPTTQSDSTDQTLDPAVNTATAQNSANTTPVRIMLRGNNNNNNQHPHNQRHPSSYQRNNNTANHPRNDSRTIEEREAAYQAARAKIFQEDASDSGSLGGQNDEHTTQSNDSGAGAYRRNNNGQRYNNQRRYNNNNHNAGGAVYVNAGPGGPAPMGYYAAGPIYAMPVPQMNGGGYRPVGNNRGGYGNAGRGRGGYGNNGQGRMVSGSGGPPGTPAMIQPGWSPQAAAAAGYYGMMPHYGVPVYYPAPPQGGNAAGGEGQGQGATGGFYEYGGEAQQQQQPTQQRREDGQQAQQPQQQQQQQQQQATVGVPVAVPMPMMMPGTPGQGQAPAAAAAAGYYPYFDPTYASKMYAAAAQHMYAAAAAAGGGAPAGGFRYPPAGAAAGGAGMVPAAGMYYDPGTGMPVGVVPVPVGIQQPRQQGQEVQEAGKKREGVEGLSEGVGKMGLEDGQGLGQ
ncbi:hypothetical protein BJ742DRAFT_572932 [Cladochytrium replicatum]|nr:hypothetical protein BJ742DRAFT_572932 [Cladochytrium replicatum]